MSQNQKVKINQRNLKVKVNKGDFIMTKKEQLIQVFNNAKKYTNDFVAVAIETKGNQGIEIIINPAYNFDQKLEYYNKAYNDDLILNTYNGISIISACSFDYDIEFTEIEEMLQNKF